MDAKDKIEEMIALLAFIAIPVIIALAIAHDLKL